MSGYIKNLGVLIIGLLVGTAFSQGHYYNNNGSVINQFGQPVANATVRVCTEPASGIPCSPLATGLYSDHGLTPPGLPNPFPTDAFGNIAFYTPNSNTIYHLQISGAGITTYDIPYVYLTLTTGAFASPPPIGNVTPNTGAFTNLTVTGTCTGCGAVDWAHPGAIGSGTPNTGVFTILNGAVVNATTFAGADICAKINAAVLAHPGATIDARGFTGNQACASNPFASASADVYLILGNVVIQTTAPWVTPSAFDALIYGFGRGSSGRGTTLQAVTGFPAACDGLGIGCPVLRLGDGSQPAFGHRMENMTVDCNGQTGSIGLYSNDIQEQSGARHFTVLNCPIKGVYMDGTGSPGQGAENYVLEDGEVYSQTYGTSTTVNIHLLSNITATNGPKSVKDITSSGAPAHIILSSYTLQGISGATLENLNAESAVTGYTLSPNSSSTTQNVHVNNVQCNLVTTNCILLQAPLNDITITNVMNNAGGGFTPVTINDTTSGLSYSDFSIAKYVVANAQNFRLNSATGGLQLLRNLNAVGFNTSNQADSLYQVDFDSGKTADQGVALILSDRGTNKWNMASVAPTNLFQIFDYANSAARLRFVGGSPGSTALLTVGTGIVQINPDAGSGTGGFQVCSGGVTPACNFTVTAAGNTTIGGTLGVTGIVTGNINGTVGAVTPSTGAFTTLSTTGAIQVGGTLTVGGGSIVNTILNGAANLTFTAISSQTCQEQNMTLTGANTTNAGAFASPRGAFTGNLSWSSYVSATNTVTVRVCNPTTGSITPAAVGWGAVVIQ